MQNEGRATSFSMSNHWTKLRASFLKLIKCMSSISYIVHEFLYLCMLLCTVEPQTKTFTNIALSPGPTQF